MDRIYHTDNPYDFEIPKDKIDILLPKNLAKEIEKISAGILIKLKEQNTTGFRLLRQLQVLAMANALINKRNMVIEQDIDTIKEITKYINFNFEEL
jgi:translation elongation factor EF-1alpha